jgi:hypothetical protein
LVVCSDALLWYLIELFLALLAASSSLALLVVTVMRYMAAMVQNVVVLNAMISGLCRDEAAVG